MRVEEAIAGSDETVTSHLLDPAAGNDVRALRAVLKVSQAVLGTHRFDDALEVIAEQTLAALDAASFSSQPLGTRARRAAHHDQCR